MKTVAFFRGFAKDQVGGDLHPVTTSADDLALRGRRRRGARRRRSGKGPPDAPPNVRTPPGTAEQ